jgi:hypothetical protein
MAIWSIVRPFGIHILWPFGIFHYYMVYFSSLGMAYQEKSGSPASKADPALTSGYLFAAPRCQSENGFFLKTFVKLWPPLLLS